MIEPVDHDHPGYVWHQVVRQILARVASGELTPGARLPSIPDMARQFEVAATTVQRALGWLIERGVVVTYIAPVLPSPLPTPPDGIPLCP